MRWYRRMLPADFGTSKCLKTIHIILYKMYCWIWHDLWLCVIERCSVAERLPSAYCTRAYIVSGRATRHTQLINLEKCLCLSTSWLFGFVVVVFVVLLFFFFLSACLFWGAQTSFVEMPHYKRIAVTNMRRHLSIYPAAIGCASVCFDMFYNYSRSKLCFLSITISLTLGSVAAQIHKLSNR